LNHHHFHLLLFFSGAFLRAHPTFISLSMKLVPFISWQKIRIYKSIWKENSTINSILSISKFNVFYQGVALNKPSPPIEIKMEVFDLSKVQKCIIYLIFLCLLIYAWHEYDPSFNGFDNIRLYMSLNRKSFLHLKGPGPLSCYTFSN